MKEQIIVGYCTNRNDWACKKFNDEIKKSIGCDHIIIPFFNDGSVSLSKAYNSILAEIFVQTDYQNSVVVFCHHDIHFKSNGWGKNLLNIFNNNEVDILGLAGTDKLYPHCSWWTNAEGIFNQEDLWGKVWHKIKGHPETKSDFTTHRKKCAKVQPAVAVDGVFLAFNPETCLPFDEDFKGFHFYDISWCLQNFLAGKKIGVTETIPIVHESGGFMNAEWEENRKQLISKYKDVVAWPISV